MARQLDNQKIVEATGSLLVQCLNERTDPGEKVTTALSVTFNALTTAAAMLMGSKFDPNNKVYPSNDLALLTGFLIHECCTMMSDASVRVEFSPPRVLEALQDFKNFTNRDGEHLLDPALLEGIKRATQVDASKFGPNSKFLQ